MGGDTERKAQGDNVQFPTTFNTFTVPTGAGQGQSRLVISSNGSLVEYSYGAVSRWVGLVGGFLRVGILNGTNDPIQGSSITTAGAIGWNNDAIVGRQEIFFQSPRVNTGDNFSNMALIAAGPTSSFSDSGLLRLNDANSAASINVGLTGACIWFNPNTFTNETWHNVSLAANVVSVTGDPGFSGGPPNLQYRKDAENNLWIYGLVQTTAAGIGVLGTVASGYWNTSQAMWGQCLKVVGGNSTPVWIGVGSGGQIFLRVSSALNDYYMLNTKMPLGFLP